MKTITFELNSDDENDNTSANEKLYHSKNINEFKKVIEKQRQIFLKFGTTLDKISSKLMESRYSIEYLENFDSIKSFLNSKGLISPKNRKEFFDWYFKQIAKSNPKLKLTDLDSYPKLDRFDILEFSQLLTKEAESEFIKNKNKLNNKVTEPFKNIKLVDCFKSVSDYTKIMLLLSEKELIEPNTHYWIDSKSANKAYIINLIKSLKSKGYFKKEISLKYELAKSIIFNTFNVEVKSNRTYYKELNAKEFDFIPTESAISNSRKK